MGGGVSVTRERQEHTSVSSTTRAVSGNRTGFELLLVLARRQ